MSGFKRAGGRTNVRPTSAPAGDVVLNHESLLSLPNQSLLPHDHGPQKSVNVSRLDPGTSNHIAMKHYKAKLQEGDFQNALPR